VRRHSVRLSCGEIPFRILFRRARERIQFFMSNLS
jgi:hypothetical protein